jgi:hypothetical protein
MSNISPLGGIRFELREEYDRSNSPTVFPGNDFPRRVISYIHLEVRLIVIYLLKVSLMVSYPVHSSISPRHVRPVFPTRPPSSQALSLTSCLLLSCHRRLRSSNRPPQPLQHAVQHVTGTPGWNGRGLGTTDGEE